MAKCIDRVGKKFNRLTVLERDYEYPILHHTKNRVTYWKCQCDCGNIVTVSAANLQSGHVKSCGCLLRERMYPYNDLLGQRFGKLTVIEKTEKRSNGRSIVWKCLCDCGNITYISESHLTGKGGTQSCGCLNSKREFALIQLFQKHNINYEYQKRFEELNRLSYDFYLPEYNLLIELHGEQHYYPIEHFGGEERFKKQQKNDEIKFNYAKENNKKLLIIPYHVKELTLDYIFNSSNYNLA